MLKIWKFWKIWSNYFYKPPLPVQYYDGYVWGEDDGVGQDEADGEHDPAEGETPGVGGEQVHGAGVEVALDSQWSP